MAGATKLLTAGGGGVILTPASSIASDVTVNVPSQNCTLGIQGPAFSAYQSSSQGIANNTFTKLQFQSKEYDTASSFDATTNYRFQPTIAGYYQISGTVAYSGTFNSRVLIYKNGVSYKNGGAGGSNQFSSVSALVYLNGSTDYAELYTYQSQGTSQSVATGLDLTYFQASLVRAA